MEASSVVSYNWRDITDNSFTNLVNSLERSVYSCALSIERSYNILFQEKF